MKKFAHFLIYNNTVPLVFGVLFLGAGATFAASPAAREAVMDSQTAITEVDNSYLLETTIGDETVTITIGSVTETATEYFIEYQMGTMEARDGVWQPSVRIGTLVVNKETVIGRDLGLYAEEEIAEVHAAEVRLLKETQSNERRAGLTPKVVTTEYSGLVGQFFDPSQEVFPQYDPVIPAPKSVPLTAAERRAYEEDQRRIANEINRQANQEEPQDPDPVEEDNNGDGGDGDTSGEEPPPPPINPPVEDPPPPPEPTPEPPVEEPPQPEPAPEPTV